MKLDQIAVEKLWGRRDLPRQFQHHVKKDAVGEIWFERADGEPLSLMTKYLFTSEKLSIQVHPNDRQARKRGQRHGKEECWFILSAEPGAVLGIGLKAKISAEKLRASALTGAIESMIDWKPVTAGDFFYIPAGTVHAIGPGVSLVEVQQNIDLTYRLYDYGRPRELHLDDGMAVSKPEPYPMSQYQRPASDESSQLVFGPHFRLLRIIDGDLSPVKTSTMGQWQIIPLSGEAEIGEDTIAAGECGLCEDLSAVAFGPKSDVLIACPAS
jgi:mannose-6-phosphate isomerase